MIKYRGYYIDGVIFSSKDQIDEFIKNSVFDKYKQFCRMFCSDKYTAKEKLAISVEMSVREKRLHEEFGVSLEELENIFEDVAKTVYIEKYFDEV